MYTFGYEYIYCFVSLCLLSSLIMSSINFDYAYYQGRIWLWLTLITLSINRDCIKGERSMTLLTGVSLEKKIKRKAFWKKILGLGGNRRRSSGG